MPNYVFLRINHLGESFEARDLNFDDDLKALDFAHSLAQQGYPIGVMLNGRCIELISIIQWRVEDWLRPHLGFWPLN